MRLDFKVLWIDDQPRLVKGAMDRLSYHVEQEGFRLEIVRAESLNAAIALIRDHVWADGIDLVLVDYDLGMGAGGERALAHIKNAMPYKEVVFYSAVPTTELRRLVFEANVEGVYCASRTSLGETITGVFDALVKKVLDINHCRGIILGATSDVDYVVNEVLRTVDGQLTDDQRAASFEYALTRVDETLERFRATREKWGAHVTMETLLAEHQLFTSADRLRLLMNMHDHRFAMDERSLRKEIGRYLERITGVRNMFGHVPLKPGEPQRALRKFGAESVDPDTLREVRKELIHFRDKFQELADLVGCVM